MNTNILRKCIEELNKDKPDLSYIKGMLETIMELSSPTPSYPPIVVPTGTGGLINVPYTVNTTDVKPISKEEENLAAYTGTGRIGKLD